MDSVRVRVWRDPRTEGVHIFVGMRADGKLMRLDHEGTWREVAENVQSDVKLCYIPGDWDLLQKLADALYDFGVTPHGYIPQRGEIEATERHLDDMRALVAKAFGVQMPKEKIVMRLQQ